MSAWPSAKARRVMAALLKLGWQLKRQSGSHRTLSRDGWADMVFAFHDGDEIGPRMLARLAKHTGLQPEDLQPRADELKHEKGTMDIQQIRTKADYEAALKAVESLMTAKARTPEGDRLEALVSCIEAYERQYVPMTQTIGR